VITGSIARSATRRYLSYSEADFEVFTARRNARIASAVLATAILSVCPSVCLFVCPSHAGIVSKRRHVVRCSFVTVDDFNI